MVLVSYGRRHVGHCHYPVPPDALGFQRFRPVPPGCDEPYGRSWPAGVEENDHLTVIENVYFYLTRTGDWFASQEDRVWNWMNM